MTPTQLTDVTIDTAEDFESVLADAAELASESNIDIEGAWQFDTNRSTIHWEAEIYQLAIEGD
jgi:hypothetical protein